MGFVKGMVGLHFIDFKRAFYDTAFNKLRDDKYYIFEVSILIGVFEDFSKQFINNSLFFGLLYLSYLINVETEFYNSLSIQEKESMDIYMKNYYLTEVNRIEEQHYQEVVEGVTWENIKKKCGKN